MSEAMPIRETSHRRFNPLTREWVLVSPHRMQRPWQGATEKSAPGVTPAYDPECYLCSGNRRADGETNPAYDRTFAFDNDFPALLPGAGDVEENVNDLLIAKGESGLCRVLCFTPRHDLSMSRMPAADIAFVVDAWAEEHRRLAATGSYRSIQIFENHGSMMGASNPHPHCQIWASRGLPNEVAKELVAQTEYRESKHACMLCDYLRIERDLGERIVFANAHFTVLVPFWAIWPFETMVLPHRHVAALDDLDRSERLALAQALGAVTVRYDNLFESACPYSMGFHQRPTDGIDHPEWHLHAHFYPPLLRSARVRKFMVGFEMLGSPQRDITPESAAQRLRELAARHYLDR